MENINNLFLLFDVQKNFIHNNSDNLSIKSTRLKLIRLYNVFKKYEKELLLYLNKEYNKNFYDLYKYELKFIKSEIRYFIFKLNSVRNKNRYFKIYKSKFFSRNKIINKPYGCCLLLFDDRFPLSKIFIPIIGALSCGNSLFVRLPSYENQLNKIIKAIFKEVFSDNFIYFLHEKSDETVIFELLKFNFDLVFYSGNKDFANIITKAFINKDTKLVFDLKNKCPLIIDETADINKATKQLVFSKMLNAGQTSFSPGYLIIHESIIKNFVNSFKLNYEKQFPKMSRWKLLSKIDTKQDFQLIVNALDKSLQKNRIIFGGEIDKQLQKIELTLISNEDLKSDFMNNDIQSPVLPVVIFNSFSDINGIVAHNENPSAIYFFSKNKSRINSLVNFLETRYFFVNNINLPYTRNLFFGGIKSSGSNLYCKKESINIFTYKKLIIKPFCFNNKNPNFIKQEKYESKIKKKYSI